MSKVQHPKYETLDKPLHASVVSCKYPEICFVLREIHINIKRWHNYAKYFDFQYFLCLILCTEIPLQCLWNSITVLT
jgi:hypothetical protein